LINFIPTKYHLHMKSYHLLFIIATVCWACAAEQQPSSRQVIPLEKEWKFMNADMEGGELPATPDSGWQTVTVPHDWAISGAFDKSVDMLEFNVPADGGRTTVQITGSTGALPHVGVGWYRKALEIPASFEHKRIHIEFDGAMSHARVFLNGEYVGEWPYGYASFGFDLTPYVKIGQDNILAVRLENKPNSSRWYPGAGIYRHVTLVVTDQVHVKQWGTSITTPDIDHGVGTVLIAATILNHSGEQREVSVETRIISDDGITVATINTAVEAGTETCVNQQLTVPEPRLWSVDHPILYTAVTRILEKGKELDRYTTPFGFRYFEFTSDRGFFLNGERVHLNGVCLHHDLGPLGAAVNLSSLRHRLLMLQSMGCNSIRTSHNPPAPEMLELADEMGFLVMDEAFDEWKHPKCENGYNTLWDEWAERDMVALIHRDRNHPSVIMWSIGNEVQEQGIEGGEKYCQMLVDICRREDPSRPTTAAFNQWENAIRNGFADIVDVPGWNYQPRHYNYIHQKFPHWKMVASETASTVSSRGEYFFPAEERIHYTREPYHCSSFDMEFPRWATSPDMEFAAQDSFPFMAGEYVWTGFDYLGEPTPYGRQWPSRSSYFGIIDLCGIPKDRFYLYQSKWTDEEVLHLLPHWNWEAGQKVSVHCYTSFDRGELFLNGKSLGIREKDPSSLYTTYRLVWDDVVYEPGEIRVVALDKEGNPLKEAVRRSAGDPAGILLDADRVAILADGKELAFVTVSIIDKEGNLCPTADNLVSFTVLGEGALKAVGNGDPTSLESFVMPYRKAFNGQCMAIIQSSETAGEITLTAESEGLESRQIKIKATD
jgi:beta-galactosidase